MADMNTASDTNTENGTLQLIVVPLFEVPENMRFRAPLGVDHVNLRIVTISSFGFLIN